MHDIPNDGHASWKVNCAGHLEVACSVESYAGVTLNKIKKKKRTSNGFVNMTLQSCKQLFLERKLSSP